MKEKTKQRIIFVISMVFVCLVIGSAVGILLHLKYRAEYMPESLTQEGISQQLQTDFLYIRTKGGSFKLPGDQALVPNLQIEQWERLDKQNPLGKVILWLSPRDGYDLEFYENGLVAAHDEYTKVGARTVYYRCPAEIDEILDYLREQKK